MSSIDFTQLVELSAEATPSSPSIISAPEVTPTTPFQELAIQSIPVEEDKQSSIDYEREAEEQEDDAPPVGFIPNSPDSRQYYPVYVINPLFGAWDLQSRTKVAKYIQYNADYTMVTGTEGRKHERRTIPVLLGRRAHFRLPMNAAKWDDFRRGSPREFLINEAIADLGDPRIIGEVNRLRGKMELKDTLGKMLKDLNHQADQVNRELIQTERDLTDTMVRVEEANLHTILFDQLGRAFPTPVKPRHSPIRSPLPPRRGGPVEMPVLMDEGRASSRVKCFTCRKKGHVARDCPKKKHQGCRLCGDKHHRRNECPYHKAVEVHVKVEEEEEAPRVQVPDQGTLSLLERIDLMNRTEWTPTVCTKCGKQQPGHNEFECPEYEYCSWCKTTGAMGFIANHKCAIYMDADNLENGWDNGDEDLYHGDDNNGW
jgi:hypothetical protein